MNLGPLISRELKEQSRRVGTYGARVVSAFAVLSLMFALWTTRHLTIGDGGQLLRATHSVLCLLAWVGVPLLVADCISRERREGTLELLYLTPLSVVEVVMAKSMAYALMVFAMLVGLAPMVMIPILLGGVDMREALVSLMINLTIIILALSAGIFASSCNSRLMPALGWAVIWTVFVTAMTACALGGWLLVVHGTDGMVDYLGPQVSDSVAALQLGLSWLVNPRRGIELLEFDLSTLTGFGRAPRPATPLTLLEWIKPGAVPLAIALLIAFILIGLAARQAGPGREAGWVQSLWLRLEPILVVRALPAQWIRNWMRRRIERNPSGWLEVRDWRSRSVIWIYVGVFMLMATLELIGVRFGLGGRYVMAGLFGLGLAGSSAGSLRRERETGFLELILVSPVGPGQIVAGRLRAIWVRFLPVMGLLVWYWFYLREPWGAARSGVRMISILTAGSTLTIQWPSDGWFIVATLIVEVVLVVPAVGLFWSVRAKSYLVGFAATLLIGLAAPVGVIELLPVVDRYALRFVQANIVRHVQGYWFLYCWLSRVIALVVLGVIGLIALRALMRRLDNRKFARV